MKPLVPACCALLLASTLVLAQAPATSPATSPTTQPLTDEEIAGRIDSTLVRAAALGAKDADERRELWLETAGATVTAIGPHQPLARPVAKAIATLKADTPPGEVVAALLPLLKSVRDDLRFTPRKEAALPPGFPAPAPVGRVVVAKYPGYRAAFTTAAEGSENGMFFKLFNHIKAADVKMTAPVEMTYDDEKPTGMAFMYERPDQGKVGEVDGVTVRDMPAMTVVSLGVRGRTSVDNISAATQELRTWLKRHPELKPAGAARVLGYNSPFNLPSDMFFEVQLPIDTP